MDNFVWPFLIFILPLPWIVWQISRYFAARVETKSDALYVPFFYRITGMNRSAFTVLQPIKSVFLILAWILLVLASMRPVYYITDIPNFHEARNIMLAIDFSTSMAERDFAITGRVASRIDVVKMVVRDFIDKRKGDRLGLIVFGSQAFTLAPLSQDMKTLDELFMDVDLGVAGEKTAIGDALALAVRDTAKIPEGKKVIIILSDGFNNSGTVSVADAVALAKKQNISVYTIGIGSKKKKSKSLLSVLSQGGYGWDEKTLLAIANETNGKYFRAESGEDLQDVYHQIDTLETTTLEGLKVRPKQELFYIPLLLALACWLIAERQRKKK